MARFPSRSQLLRSLAIVLLAGLGLVGLKSGIADWSDAAALEQRVATVFELGNGLLGLLAAGALLARRSWTVGVLIAWAVAISVAAGMAPVVWGGAGMSAAIPAGSGTALIASAIAWLGRRALAA